MKRQYRFDRLEFAGSLGDLGTLLPLALGMIMINGLSPCGLLLSIGIFYICSGLYYGVTVSVQPMKVIAAYAVAMSLTGAQVAASGLLVACALLLVGGTGAIAVIGRHIPKSVIRGVQMATGILLMVQGVKFVMGSSNYQLLLGLAEPYLRMQHIGVVPVGLIIGGVGAVLTFLLLENKRLPAGLVVVFSGVFFGIVLGTHSGFDQIQLGVYLPEILPFGFPTGADFSFALLVLVLPQLPMTLGNAVLANADLSKQYFQEDAARVTPVSLCYSMGLANILCFMVGGMPLCHGAGGLAAHYRFGARTAGSNLIIGAGFILLALLLGRHALAIMHLVPFAILGILLIFAGSQLALTILDIRERKELFVIVLMVALTLALNLAIAFGIGFFIALLLRHNKLSI